MNPFKLRVRIGENEFEGEGSEETVKAQFKLFLDSTAGHEPPGDKPNWGAIPLPRLKRIFHRGKDWSVWIDRSRHPDTDTPEHDLLVVLIYGIQAFRNLLEGPVPPPAGGLPIEMDRVATASQLIVSARKSGLKFDRIDRFLSGGRKGNDVFRGGAKRGSTYSLTQPGRDRAVELLKMMLEE